MIIDKLLLDFLAHTVKWVEGSLEVTFKGLQGLYDLVHNIESLLLGETRPKWEISQVSSYSDSCGDDHGSIFWGKGRSLQLGGIHI